MKLQALVVAGVLLAAAPVAAQKINGHPQKAFYASPTEYKCIETQGHTARLVNGVPIPVDSMESEHGHMGPVCGPIWAETAGEVLHFTASLKNFHVKGGIGQIWGELITNVKWEATGTSTSPVMTADPTGLKDWKFSFDVDPKLGGKGWTALPHGEFYARLAMRVYADGMQQDDEQWIPLFSVQDTTKPIPLIRGNARTILESQVDIFDRQAPEKQQTRLGTNVIEYLDYVPILAPINRVWRIPVHYYNYSADPALPCGSLEVRLDPDFHNGIPGKIVDRVDCFNAANGPVRDLVLDPAVIGPGTHAIVPLWTQVDPVLGEQMSVLSKLVITVDANVPPAVCEDPRATNQGGPLPCVIPVVPPDWHTLTGLFQQLGSLLQFRFCTTPTQCDIYVKQQ